MKTIWTILGTLMAASLFAQNNPSTLPAVPPPVNSPAAETAPPPPAQPPANPPATPPVKHIKKHHVVKPHRPAAKEPTVTIAPGPAEVSASELVVRGQAGLKGEEVAHLAKGDTVNVLEQINLEHHAADEPSQWVKISYPKTGHVWVMAKYIKDGVVSTKKLNLRAGHGENYSVVGVIEQGTPVKEIETKNGWTEIEPPENAYAFVAAKYLTQEAMPPTAMATTQTPEPEPQPTPVQPPQPVVLSQPPAPQPLAPPQPQPPQVPQATVRIVQHQGVVGGVGSIQAPTAYKLYDPDTKADIDFLYPTSPDQDLHSLVDDQVIVTGEEGVDPRFPNTPVIAIQNIQIIGKNVIKRLDLTPPRLRH